MLHLPSAAIARGLSLSSSATKVKLAARHRERPLAVALAGLGVGARWSAMLRPCFSSSAKTLISSPTAGAPVKARSSAATTTHLPRALREARLPAASAIWLISHPPNTPP